MTAADLSDQAAEALVRLREAAPRVHCITNTVSQPITANGLLALGAVPSLTTDPAEVADFTVRADALAINLGTLDNDRRSAIETALEIAVEEQRPFVLDPVFIDVSAQRCDYARGLLDREPDVIRLNGPEFSALSGEEKPNPQELALQWLTTIAVTGKTDRVTDGSASATLSNGHPLMARVTAMGCLASAVVAAFLPVSPSPFIATISGLTVMGVAGELAARQAGGPGTFAVQFIDALAGLTPAMIRSQSQFADDDE